LEDNIEINALKGNRVKMWPGLSCSRWGPVEGPFEHGNEPFSSIKGEEFID
jgi:hypothetical protein